MSDTADVHEVSSKTVIQEQQRLDMNSNKDLPADCNGIKHVVGDEDDDEGANVGGRGVPGGSYVLVSGTDADPVKEDLNADESNLVPDSKLSSLSNGAAPQVGEFDVDNGKISLSAVENDHNYVFYGADVITSNQDEALASQPDASAAEVASSNTAEEPNETVISEPEPQQLVCVLKVEDPIELHSSENFPIPVVEATADLECEKSAILSSLVANLESDQPNNLDSIAELGQSEKCQNVVLEDAESVEVGELKSEDPDNLDSIPEPEKSETCQNLVLEAAECESLEVEVGGLRSDEQSELKLAKEIVECPESQTITSEYGLYQLDNEEVKSEAQSQLNSTSEVVDCPESQIIECDGSGLHQLDNGEENLEVKTSTYLVLDDSAREIKENLGFQITMAESGSYQHDHGFEGVEERKKTDLDIDVQGAREVQDNLDFPIAITESVESGSYQRDHGEERVDERKKKDLDVDLEGHEVSVTDVIQGHEAAQVDEEIDVPLEAGTPRDIASYEKHEVSEMESCECIGGSKKFPENQLPVNAESLRSLNDCVTSESELGDLPTESAQSFPVDPSDDGTAIEQAVGYGAPIITVELLTCGAAGTICETGVENLDVENSESSLSCPASDVISDIVVKNDQVGDDEPSSSPAKYTSSETKIVFGSINPEEEVPTLESDDVHVESKPSNGHIECVGSQSSSADRHIYGSLQNGSSADVDPESEVDNSCSISSGDLGTNDATAASENWDLSAINSESASKSVVPGIVDVKGMGDEVNGCHGGSDTKLLCQESESIGSMRIDEIPASLAGSSSANIVESSPNSVLEILVSDNGGEQVSGGVADDSFVGTHVAEIPACLAGISSVESAPNSDPEIVGVENGVDDKVNGATDNKLICHETNNNVEEIQGDGILPTSLPDAVDAEADAVARPFHFLIRIPRLDDEKIKEQIRLAKLRVEDKTRLRDNIRTQLQAKRANCQALDDAYEVSKSEARAARRLVRLKRAEIDSAQSVINKVKNAMSVEDIDNRICNMEHMINHETLPLKEEKQFIREMKQLRHLKEQLSSNMGSQDEVQQAMDQKDEIEERLRILKKELDSLKVMISKAEVNSAAAKKKCDEEGMLLRELQAQFRAADDIRQEEYLHFLSLKRQAFEKNKHYWTFKDDIKASLDYASSGDLVGLHHACVNQVDKFMELWNKNDEFRRDYVRCNMRSTVRRLRTLDGRSLGPDEEPPVMASYVNERKGFVVDNRFASSKADKVNSVSLVPTPPPQQGKQVVSPPVESEVVVGGEGKSSSSSMEKVVVVLEQRNHTATKTEKNAKPISRVNGSATTVSSRGGYDEAPKEEEKEEENNNMQLQQQTTDEQEELAKKAAELEAKLKEQRRLEEKAKAQEALERKRRNAEKAQIRAALKAQKEAEQKEKEREKRLKKKERKKTGIAEGGQDEGESGLTSSEIKESEMKEKSSGGTAAAAAMAGSSSSKRGGGAAAAASSSYFRKQSKLKSIPPLPAPMIRNRSGKRRMQQLMWLAVATVLLVALFLFGSNSFFIGLQMRRRNGV